ncbi:MAG: hypothetical protein ACNA8K_06475 [Cyclonatronaceae bacterium]
MSHLNEFTQKWLIDHLTEITGVQLEVNARGMLVGKEGAEINESSTSESARDDLMYAIGAPTIVRVRTWGNDRDAGSQFDPAYNVIYLNLDQIMYHEMNSEGITSLTMGIGMTFLHELNHSPIGFTRKHTPHSSSGVDVTTDPVFLRNNLYREEMGAHMGQQENYNYAYTSYGRPFIGFGNRNRVYGNWYGGPYPYTNWRRGGK